MSNRHLVLSSADSLASGLISNGNTDSTRWAAKRQMGGQRNDGDHSEHRCQHEDQQQPCPMQSFHKKQQAH